MIKSACKQCGTLDGVRYITFCDSCGLEIEGMSVNIDVVVTEGNPQRHFHSTCVPAFEMSCSLCKATADKYGNVKHDAKLHGDKRPAEGDDSRD